MTGWVEDFGRVPATFEHNGVEYVSFEQAAAILDMTKSQLEYRVKRDKLTPVRITERFSGSNPARPPRFFERDEVERYAREE